MPRESYGTNPGGAAEAGATMGHSRVFGLPMGMNAGSRVEALPLLGGREVSSSDDAGSGVDGTAASRGGLLGDEVLLASRKKPYKSLGWSLIAVRGGGGGGGCSTCVHIKICFNLCETPTQKRCKT
jgi:hypothetical protein